MVLSNQTGMKGTRVNGAATSVGGEELGKGGVKIVGNEGRNNVLVAVRDDKKETRTNGVEVVLPSWAREYTWLRASGTWCMSLCISIHCFGCQ